MAENIVPFKVYFIHHDSDDSGEIRRFGLPASESSFQNFNRTITELLPNIGAKGFKVYWEDEDDDRVAISSDAEFIVALASMNFGTRKFYVKINSGLPDNETSVLHPGVYCDICDSHIIGFRYKCLMCNNYDLCRTCEQAGLHAEHPMLRIPHPVCYDRVHLKKLTEYVSTSLPLRTSTWPQRRRHSHDNSHSDSHKKKKRSEHRDASHETGDEMDESCHKKHSHKKWRAYSDCPFSQMEYFIPLKLDGRHGSRKTQEESGQGTYLKWIATTIQKLMDPLGVNVEFEVRPNHKNSEERKEEGKAEGKGEEKKKEEKAPVPGLSPSAPIQKEVRFESPEQIAETMKQGIEEITKKFAKQKMSTGNSVDDGWVSFEELRRDSEQSRSSSVESIPKTPQQEGAASEAERPTPGTSAGDKEPTAKLYPALNSQPSNEKVAKALEQMLGMGFSNEEGWLTHMLETKHGDITLVLEALMPKKN